MGYYKKGQGMSSGKPFFQQMDSHVKGWFLYYFYNDKEKTGRYQIGPELGGIDKKVRCSDTAGHLKSHAWQYYDQDNYGEKFADDVNITVEPVERMESCNLTTIKLSGDASYYQDHVAGEYISIDIFSAGRNIYKHKNREIFLQILPGDSYWSVSDKVGGGKEFLRSASAGSRCPADQRNNYSHRNGYKTWRYRSIGWFMDSWYEAGGSNIVIKTKE